MSEDQKLLSITDGIDFNLPILNIKGEPMNQQVEGGAVVPYRLGDICIGALCGTVPGEKIDGTQRFKRLQLALKIQGSGEAEDSFGVLKLKDAQKKMILDLAAAVINPQTGLPGFSTLIYGRLHEVLKEDAEDED